MRLTTTEWAVVVHLTHRRDRVVSQHELVEAVWGKGDATGRSLIRVHMYNIRHKLEADPANPVHFLNDYGSGYKFRTVKPPVDPSRRTDR